MKKRGRPPLPVDAKRVGISLRLDPVAYHRLLLVTNNPKQSQGKFVSKLILDYHI